MLCGHDLTFSIPAFTIETSEICHRARSCYGQVFYRPLVSSIFDPVTCKSLRPGPDYAMVGVADAFGMNSLYPYRSAK